MKPGVAMMKRFAYLILVWLAFFVTCCSNKSVTAEADRISGTSEGTVAVSLNGFQFDADSEFLLTITNSTQTPIELFKPAIDSCFANTFWFYAKTNMGWQPIPPILSFKCSLEREGDVRIRIPDETEKELDVRFLMDSRDLVYRMPATYMLRVKYLDSLEQELLLFTDEFQIGQTSSSNEFYVVVENKIEPDPLSFVLTNHSEHFLWLAPPCAFVDLASGWIDEENSRLQRLTTEGAWSNIQFDRDSCLQMTDFIAIAAGETTTINGLKWIQDAGINLQPGYYRWDIVFYLAKTELGVQDGYHLFSAAFEY